MTIIFECGCQGTITGSEHDTPRCPLHLKPMRRIVGERPRITGQIQSPLKVGNHG